MSVHSGYFSVVLWFIYLTFCINICLGVVQIRFLSHLTNFCVSYCRKQDLNVLYQVCVFSSRLVKQDGGPGLWLAEIFSTSLKPMNPFSWKNWNKICLNNQWMEFIETWQEARFYSSFTEFVVFRPIRKTRWPPWPLIGWDIFDFFSETAERNSSTSPKNFSFCNSRFLRVAHSLIQPIRMKSTVTYT